MNSKRIISAVAIVSIAATSLALAQKYDSVGNFWQSIADLEIISNRKPENIQKTTRGGISADKDKIQSRAGSVEREPVVPNDEQDQITYHLLFNLVRIYDYEARELETKGENGDHLRNYFQEQGNLSAAEFQVLEQIAHEHAVRMAPIHKRAMEIINARHARLSQTAPNQIAPEEIPAELKDLNRQRNDLALQFRDQFRAQIGEEAFSRFAGAMERNFVSQLQIAAPGAAITNRSEIGANQPKGGLK